MSLSDSNRLHYTLCRLPGIADVTDWISTDLAHFLVLSLLQDQKAKLVEEINYLAQNGDGILMSQIRRGNHPDSQYNFKQANSVETIDYSEIGGLFAKASHTTHSGAIS